MQRRTHTYSSILAGLTLALVAMPALAADNPALGRWDISLDDRPTPCWLEINQKGDGFDGRFLHIYASVFDLDKVIVDGNQVKFNAADHVWTGTIDGDAITGTRTHKNGNKGKWVAKRFVPRINVTGAWRIEGENAGALMLRHQDGGITGALRQGEGRPARLSDVKLDGYDLTFTAGDKRGSARVKGDVLDGQLDGQKFTAKRERNWGEPIELFNGKNLDDWKPLGDPNNYKWRVVEGIMHCDGGSSNIVTERAFDDFKLHVEFKVPKGGNSGVYLRGRYEVQVADSAGRTPGEHDCGGLYSRIIPKVNACTPAGEWQTFDITLVGYHLTVVHNGKTIIDNQDVEGITGGAIDSRETEPGPIYLQGDHTAVDYRKITLTPAGEPIGGRGGRRAQRDQ